MPNSARSLAPDFFEQPVLRLARALLGQHLVVQQGEQRLAGRIVETEAYAGRLDPAAHGYRGPTARCATMFGPAGHIYVYFTYGNHHCANVTAGPEGTAVLLRAIEPVSGLAQMRAARADSTPSSQRSRLLRAGALDRELANGPGKLCAAMGIDLDRDGTRLCVPAGIWIESAPRVRAAHWTPRIGLGRNEAARWLWRCVDSRSTGTTPVPRSWPRAARPAPRVSALRVRARTLDAGS